MRLQRLQASPGSPENFVFLSENCDVVLMLSSIAMMACLAFANDVIILSFFRLIEHSWVFEAQLANWFVAKSQSVHHVGVSRQFMSHTKAALRIHQECMARLQQLSKKPMR